MNKFSKIAIINVGWSDDYDGSPAYGNFGYVKDGTGHECFNFRPGPDGHYYVYVPPIGKNPPKPESVDGWLVFMVSKKGHERGMRVAGWFENAQFLGKWEPRPDAVSLGKDADGNPFGYTFRADRAVAIPPVLRTFRISGDNVKRPYAYLKGGRSNEPWRGVLASELLGYRRSYSTQTQAELAPGGAANGAISIDPEHRQQVEKAAIDLVKKHYARNYLCRDHQRERGTGYDLEFIPRSGKGPDIHVEVKGTALAKPHFMITRAERAYAEKLGRNDGKPANKDGKVPPLWRLAMVTDALDRPTLRVLAQRDVEAMFDFDIISWHATTKVD
jgi:hypothetical protein